MINLSERYNQIIINSIILTETQKSILGHLIDKKELNRYEISKATKHAYSGIHKAVKKLLRDGFIEISRKDKGQRNPNMEVEFYRITWLGIIEFLRSSKVELFQYAICNDSPSYSLINGSDKKWRRILLNLMRRHSGTFPEEFQEFSKDFALVLCADYCFIHAYTGLDPTKWPLLDAVDDELKNEGLPCTRGIPFAREYMNQNFRWLIEAKTNKRAPSGLDPHNKFLVYPWNEKYMETLCNLMDKKDLLVLVDLVERFTLILRRNYEATVENLEELLIYLKGVKSGLQSGHDFVSN